MSYSNFFLYREDAEKMAASASAEKTFPQNSQNTKTPSNQASSSSGK